MKNSGSSIKTIQDSFKSLRLGFYLVLSSLIFLVVISIFGIFYILKITSQKVYIISPHQTFMANASYDHEVSIYEARNIIKLLCDNLFSWDKDSYRSHMELAINLLDHSDGLKIFNTFKENEVYENLVSTSAKVSVQLDSIQLDMNSIPIKGIFYLSQIWQSVGGTQVQKIKAKFELISVSRSETNPYGLLIQKIFFLDYAINKKENRDSISLIKSIH